MRLINTKFKTFVALCTGMAITTGIALADGDSAVLSINNEVIETRAPAPVYMDIDEIISGWVFRTKETQALQMDDQNNPGMQYVVQARIAWDTPDGTEGKSCASCHGSPESFVGLRTELPRWNETAGAIWTMEDYINDSRVKHMGAEPWAWGKAEMDAMLALISLQSRGMAMNVAIDGPAAPAWQAGQELYYTRFGQLDMACANCHEDNFGLMLRDERLSQGQTNGFPAFRLKNAKLNSTHTRFAGCMTNIRATPFAVGSDEFRALELYVASRGNGLSVEGPSVRN